MEPYLNIGGSEWVIIIFTAIVLILGTGKLPEAARKIGKASAEYRKARDEVGEQIGWDAGGHGSHITGPVENERKKFETIARSLGVEPPVGSSTDDLKEIIRDRMGHKTGGGDDAGR